MQVLDLSHNKISSLSALHFRIGNVAKISLASNEIKSLNGEYNMTMYKCSTCGRVLSVHVHIHDICVSLCARVCLLIWTTIKICDVQNFKLV